MRVGAVCDHSKPQVLLCRPSSMSPRLAGVPWLHVLAVFLSLPPSSNYGPSSTNGPFIVVWAEGAATTATQVSEKSDDVTKGTNEAAILANQIVNQEDACRRQREDDEKEKFFCPSSSFTSHYGIPMQFDAPFGAYPNLLNITEALRRAFHPVVDYPNALFSSVNGDAIRGDRTDAATSIVPVSDNRQRQGLASLDDIAELQRLEERRSWLRRQWRQWKGRILCRPILSALMMKECRLLQRQWIIGKYDENRVGMYNSDLFDDTTNTIDGFGGRRTVHLGIDLGAPVGTPVWSFSDGIVHSVGYNDQLGDYGYVIVVEHFWEATATEPSRITRVWALYGHLDKSVLRGGRRKPGDSIRKGQLIGKVGDSHENGGWREPHVHFQLSLRPPDQPHDMPGASSVEDRSAALCQYPDPRYVLGPIYG
jgi:murein DD-endopeptidase MepM/ murein hydrolase activator NlpD